MIAGEHCILAIESAIAGGSLSLIRGDEELGNWVGRADVSKAEELLVNIDAMLTASGVSKHDLNLIAVSAGPGSFTGIRIGIATALGLKIGLGIPLSSVSALEAMCRTAGSLPSSGNNKNTQAGSLRSDVVAVPVGRNSICVQSFDNEDRPVGEPRTIAGEDLDRLIDDQTQVVMHSVLAERYAERPNVTDFGANIAYAVGRLARTSPGALTEPLFISKSF